MNAPLPRWLLANTTYEASLPEWAPVLESMCLFYIVGDVLLLIIATMLLLTFWCGRFA